MMPSSPEHSRVLFFFFFPLPSAAVSDLAQREEKCVVSLLDPDAETEDIQMNLHVEKD